MSDSAVYAFTGAGFPIAGLPLEYNPSRQYNYHYSTSLRFNEPGIDQASQSKKDVGFLFTSEVSLTPLWNTNNKMLFRMEVDYSNHWTNIATISYPTLVGLV